MDAIVERLGKIQTCDAGKACGNELLPRLLVGERPMAEIVSIYISRGVFDERVAYCREDGWGRIVQRGRRLRVRLLLWLGLELKLLL